MLRKRVPLPLHMKAWADDCWSLLHSCLMAEDRRLYRVLCRRNCIGCAGVEAPWGGWCVFNVRLEIDRACNFSASIWFWTGRSINNQSVVQSLIEGCRLVPVSDRSDKCDSQNEA